MLIDMESRRRAHSPQATLIPFRAEQLEPKIRNVPLGKPGRGAEGSTAEPLREMSFDAPDASLTVEWIRTDRPWSPRVNPCGTGQQLEWWYIAKAAPGAYLSLGLKRPMEPDEIEQAALDGSLGALLRRIEPAVGDTFLVEPGTIHALGPGLSVVAIKAPARAASRPVDLGEERELRHAVSMGEVWLDPMPLSTMPGEDAPFRIATELLGPEQRVMLMDQSACVAVVEGGGTFGNQPYAGHQCWWINGPLPARAIEPTVMIVAAPQQPTDGSISLRQARN